MKILIAEDEIELQQSIVTFLKKDYNVCEFASNYEEAIYRVSLYEYDIALIDINLLSGSGLDVIKKLKSLKRETGVIIISANGSLEDKINGLDIGADDYITKPFHLTELNSRIKALYRRRKKSGSNLLIFNELIINTSARFVTVNDKEVILTKKEYELLLFLMTNKNRVLTKENIAEHLWGDNSDLLDNFDFIYVHINNLRKKLKSTVGKYINTIYGVGYKFTEKQLF